jgi:hypothetical protein
MPVSVSDLTFKKGLFVCEVIKGTQVDLQLYRLNEKGAVRADRQQKQIMFSGSFELAKGQFAFHANPTPPDCKGIKPGAKQDLLQRLLKKAVRRQVTLDFDSGVDQAPEGEEAFGEAEGLDEDGTGAVLSEEAVAALISEADVRETLDAREQGVYDKRNELALTQAAKVFKGAFGEEDDDETFPGNLGAEALIDFGDDDFDDMDLEDDEEAGGEQSDGNEEAVEKPLAWEDADANWVTALGTLAGDVGSLQTALRAAAQGLDDEDLLSIADSGLAQLTAGNRTKVQSAVFDVSSSTGADRVKALAAVESAAQDYLTHIDAHPAFAAIAAGVEDDGPPKVSLPKVDVEILRTALNKLKSAAAAERATAA